MSNRVLLAVQKQETAIRDRLAAGLVTQATLDALHKSLDMQVGEYCMFQERKSLAVASGKLTLEEGQTVYAYLGNSPTTFNGQSVAVKAVLTQLFASLIGAGAR